MPILKEFAIIYAAMAVVLLVVFGWNAILAVASIVLIVYLFLRMQNTLDTPPRRRRR